MYINGIRNEQEILELLIKNVHTLTLYEIYIDHEMYYISSNIVKLRE